MSRGMLSQVLPSRSTRMEELTGGCIVFPCPDSTVTPFLFNPSSPANSLSFSSAADAQAVPDTALQGCQHRLRSAHPAASSPNPDGAPDPRQSESCGCCRHVRASATGGGGRGSNESARAAAGGASHRSRSRASVSYGRLRGVP
jgi:hypothetical protein